MLKIQPIEIFETLKKMSEPWVYRQKAVESVRLSESDGFWWFQKSAHHPELLLIRAESAILPVENGLSLLTLRATVLF